MKRSLWIGCVSLALMAAAVAAEDDFSRTVRREEFVAAGLEKLSPDELARLDALVRDYKRGRVSEAEARAAQAETEARAAQADAAEQRAAASRLEQIEERLNPRAAIALKPMETRIKGRFTGWDGRTVFYLENGERWRVSNSDSSYYTPPIENPKVRIEPAALSGFWMTIVDLNQRVRVTPLGKR